MPSASSGRYQSRIFNFIRVRSRRLTEQCDRAFRHLQVATSWGIQLLLHPLYLLFQSTEIAGKQLHSSAQQSWLQLQADDIDSQPQTSSPTADTPIQRVLLLVEDLPSLRPSLLPSEEAISNSSQAKAEPSNLLAFLATWQFKFFPNANSPTHNRPVISGIATQLSNRTLVLVTAQNEILDILTPQQQQKLQKRIIREVADYWRYQKLAHVLAQQQHTTRNEVALHRALAFLDRTVARLEAHPLASVSEVAKAHTLRIQALIWAAIDYFFGGRSGKQLGQTTPTDSSLELPSDSKPKRNSPQLVSSDVDSWLTLSDLFGKPESEGEHQQASGLVKRQKPTKGKAVAVGKGISPQPVSGGEISQQRRSQSTQLQPAPDWIETQATAIGYVKHPLEQVLEWLDRAMLWLEEVLIGVLQWLRQLWGNSLK